ncbi:conserved hypothetical protein [Rippkaea orientalis PCC 8801]|uniref:DUF3143 domain-containing protein n=1 Tax=Rippkaea orientalis (strain PCC 8801 / RF-1) TaxID=41431 RepID=B7K445_RIPO1|nr:DUF3143 domain-containing protein [Rippkaea orientalis]ACK67751.1 conserved hypothetical protein [Rippkaea orientalis PCC 8801]
MTLPAPETPLYNHPLPEIEKWLTDLGCQQDRENLHCWTVQRPTWKAQLCLDTEELIVSYLPLLGSDQEVTRAFKYSLSRQDLEDAVFSGP